MNNNAVYEQLINLPSLLITGVDFTDRKITIECKIRHPDSPCPNCKERRTKVNQYCTRILRDLNMGPREVYLHLSVRQFLCTLCNRYYTEDPDFADRNKDHTDRQADYMFIVCRHQTYTETAAIVNTSHKTVERVVLAKCAKFLEPSKRYAQVRRLGIDEQSHRKGKKDYVCVLTDLDRGIIVDMLPDRKKATLSAHFKQLGEAFCRQIEFVCCDQWEAYIHVAKENFPNAKIVLDRFHTVKMLNECLDKFRRTLRKEDKNNPLYKKIKWIVFKQYHKLSDSELDKLDEAFGESPLLKKLYFKRDEFHQIFDNSPDVERASAGIEIWKTSLVKEGLNQFDDFVKSIKFTAQYIANYVLDNVSNAVTEGLNNLIRTIKRTAYGMTNLDHLKLRVLAVST